MVIMLNLILECLFMNGWKPLFSWYLSKLQRRHHSLEKGYLEKLVCKLRLRGLRLFSAKDKNYIFVRPVTGSGFVEFLKRHSTLTIAKSWIAINNLQLSNWANFNHDILQMLNYLSTGKVESYNNDIVALVAIIARS